jgi:Fur family transcriptional regulator, ferric uptake regulator
VLEVGEHPVNDGASRSRIEELRPERRPDADPFEQLAASGFVQPATLVERIEPHAGLGADKEVPRHSDRVEVDAAAPSDLDHEHAERDRYPESPLEDIVQVRVPGIGVVVGVAGKALVDEQVRGEGCGVVRRTPCEVVDLFEYRGYIQLRMCVRGDEQRRDVESNLLVGLRDERSESGGDVHRTDGTGVFSSVKKGAGSIRGMGAAPEASLRDTVAGRLRRVNQRMTSNRETIVGVLDRATRPLTIPDILATEAGLAQSSVYRNLVVLEQAGVVHRVVTGDEYARYELAEDLTGHHHHLVCASCGTVEDVPASAGLERSVEQATVQIAQATGFNTHRHRIDLVGLCRSCS